MMVLVLYSIVIWRGGRREGIFCGICMLVEKFVGIRCHILLWGEGEKLKSFLWELE